MALADQVFANVVTNVKAGVLGSTPQLVTELTQLTTGLADEELNDANVAITKFSELVQAGQSPASAWATVSGPWATQAKSDAWNAFVTGIADVTSWFSSLVTIIEAAL